jgi:hypothetical protein
MTQTPNRPQKVPLTAPDNELRLRKRDAHCWVIECFDGKRWRGQTYHLTLPLAAVRLLEDLTGQAYEECWDFLAAVDQAKGAVLAVLEQLKP